MKIFSFGHDVGGPITDLAWGGPGYAATQMFVEASKPTEAENRENARQTIVWVLKMTRERPNDVLPDFLVDARALAVAHRFPDYVKQLDAEMPKFAGKKMPEQHLTIGAKVGIAAAFGVMLFAFSKGASGMKGSR